MPSVKPIGTTRRITLGFMIPGDRRPQFFTLWPNRVNRCPPAIWGKLLAAKGSMRPDGSRLSPLEEYLESGIVWEMSPEEANRIVDGEGRIIAPRGMNAGIPKASPREPEIPNKTAAELEMESRILSADPNPDRFEPTGDTEIKPPPLPSVGK